MITAYRTVPCRCLIYFPTVRYCNYGTYPNHQSTASKIILTSSKPRSSSQPVVTKALTILTILITGNWHNPFTHPHNFFH